MLKNFKLSLLENASSLSILSSISIKQSHRIFAQDLAQYNLFLSERQPCTGSVLRVPPSFLEYSLTVLSQHSERFDFCQQLVAECFESRFKLIRKQSLKPFLLLVKHPLHGLLHFLIRPRVRFNVIGAQ